MNRKEHKLLTYRASKFFDFEKLAAKNPELYSELCEKYPIKRKECVFAIIYKEEESVPEVKTLTESVSAEPVEEPESVDDLVDEGSVTTERDPFVYLSGATKEFPDDYQPLYSVGEQIQISPDNGEHIDSVQIRDIGLYSGTGYVYVVEILSTGELFEFDENKLTELEVWLKSYELLDKLSKETLDNFHRKWDEFVEEHHDRDLEVKWDKLNIEVYFNDGFTKCDKDFKISYFTSLYDLNQCFSHRPELKQLFDNKFKFVILKEKSKFVQHLIKDFNDGCRHPVVRSPETNICGYDQRDLTVFINEDNELYCYTGACYYQNTNTFSFTYLGRIIK